MALAGPAANFTLALLAGLAIRLGFATHIFAPPQSIHFTELVRGAGIFEGIATFVSVLFSLNVLLGAFNLLPIPPLDGSSAIAFFMPERLALRYIDATRSRMLAIVGLVIAWQLFTPVFRPVFRFALRLLYAGL